MTSDAEIERKLYDAVDRLGLALRLARQAVATHLGVTPLQLMLLQVLLSRGAQRLGSLAKEIDITQPTISDAVATLAAKRLVERQPDPDDGRSTMVSLTKLGHEHARSAEIALRPPLQPNDPAHSDERATALKVLITEIRRLQQHGLITINRSCLSCQHFQPDTRDAPARCKLLEADLTPGDLRVDCPEHLQLDHDEEG